MTDAITKIKILTSYEQIEDACHILYKVYIEKLQWNIDLQNPSRLRIEERNGRKILTDDFTDNATWFGIFKGEKLIGCARAHGVDENGLLEMERFENSKVIKDLIPRDRSSCVEMNKFAMLSDYVTPGIIKTLFFEIFSYYQKNGYSAVATTGNKFLKNFFKRIEFNIKMENAFKYHNDDSESVNFYVANCGKMEILNILHILEDGLSRNCPKNQEEIAARQRELLASRERFQKEEILRALQIVAPILPIPVYWQDRNGVVLGVNEPCLLGMGATKDIIGKSPYDFYPKETADHILNHHELVMSNKTVLSQEERINDITTGKIRYFSSTKAPLCSLDGEVIGIVGTSIEITDSKESERLKQENERLAIENSFQNKLIMEQKTFKEVINQAVHDIRSPLASLLIVSKYTKNLSEEVVSIISGASKRINDIANNLLTKYRLDEKTSRSIHYPKTNFQVSLALQEILSEKKYEYYDYNVEFDVDISLTGYLAFLHADEATFKRMISNVVNNAVESLKDKTGIVAISLDTSDHTITISIEDNGVGMPESVVEKIKRGICVTDGKKEGYGIGYTQIRDTLEKNNGHFDVESTVGKGTKVVLTFAKTVQPAWIAEKIELKMNDTVMILDDDTAIHKAWEMRLKDRHPSISLKYFKVGADAIAFVEKLSEEERERILFLVDYELLDQELNGLEVIERVNLPRSLLVTGRFSNRAIQSKLNQIDVEMLPKLYISDIPITVNH